MAWTARWSSIPYSVPWRLIGERVRVLVAAETVRITHAGSEVARHHRSAGRRGRIVDRTHFAGVARAMAAKPLTTDAFAHEIELLRLNGVLPDDPGSIPQSFSGPNRASRIS